MKYYLIGFILGDGCLECRKDGTVYRLSISTSDEQILNQFVDFFPGVHVYGPYKGNYSISFNDFNICKSLLDFGFVSAKSISGMKLPNIPSEFYYSFLCGLLDSDGTIFHSGSNIDLIWYGHHSYMVGVLEILQSLGYTASFRNHISGTELFVLRMHTNDECVQLLNLLNLHSPFKFPRKRECHTVLSGRVSRDKSINVNNFLSKNPPKNRIELLELCQVLKMSESAITKRLERLGIKYYKDYSNCGKYERKHKEKK